MKTQLSNLIALSDIKLLVLEYDLYKDNNKEVFNELNGKYKY